MHDPSLGIVGNHRLPRLVRGVLYPRLHTHLQGLIDPLEHALARHLQSTSDLAHRLAGLTAPQNLGALHLTDGSGTRLTQRIKIFLLLSRENESWTLGCPCHAISIAKTKHYE